MIGAGPLAAWAMTSDVGKGTAGTQGRRLVGARAAARPARRLSRSERITRSLTPEDAEARALALGEERVKDALIDSAGSDQYYTGLLTCSGTLTASLDEEHVEAIARLVYKDETGRLTFRWRELGKLCLIRVGMPPGQVYAELFGPPTVGQMRTLREMAARGQRDRRTFYWSVLDRTGKRPVWKDTSGLWGEGLESLEEALRERRGILGARARRP